MSGSATLNAGAKLQSPAGEWPHSTLALGAFLFVLYVAIMSAKFALWHGNVLFNDWTFYNTSFWNTDFHNSWMFSYDHHALQGYPTYLNEHFAPALFALAALYNLVPYPEAMLLLIHGATPIAAAAFIYATALRVVGDRRLSFNLALIYAFSPGILWPTISMVYGFQTDCLLAPCAAAAGWALATNRAGAFFVAFLVALGLKENVPAYGVILGLCLFVFSKRHKQALAIIALSLIVFLIAAKGVPAITGVANRNVGTVWRFLNDFIHLHPHFDFTRSELAIGVGYSLAFLPALYVWPYLGTLVPDLLLIGQVPQAKLVTWHVMLPVTVLGVASVFGFGRMLATKRWPVSLDRHLPRLEQLRLFTTAVLAASLVAGPLTIWLSYQRYIAFAVDVDPIEIAQAQSLVPATAGVATTSDLEQYFAHRRVVTSHPAVLRKAPGDFSYIAVNRNALTPARHADSNMASVYAQDRCLIDAAEKLAHGGGTRVLDSGGILVVRFTVPPNLACE